MKEADLRQAISEAKLNNPKIQDVVEASKRKYEFKVQGRGSIWKLLLVFPYTFPYRLPAVQLLNKDKIGEIPHVNRSGVICVEESDSILLDYARAGEIIDSFVTDTIKLLDRASLKLYKDELFNELEGYFNFKDKVKSFYSAGDNTEYLTLRIRQVKSRKIFEQIPIVMLGRDNSLPNDFSNLSKSSKTTSQKIIHLALENPVLPPRNQGDITPSYFDELKGNLSRDDLGKFKKLAKAFKKGRSFFILVSMPREYGERTQYLLRFSSKTPLSYPVEVTDSNWGITSYAIIRHNKEYLLERGGAETNLNDKKVCVIGCGSVGGEIASMLAKSGVGELVLVDDDSFEADNIYRHRLGGSSLDFQNSTSTDDAIMPKKVSALASSLQSDTPYLKIKQKPVKFDEITGSTDLLNSDVVIVAVGSPSTNLYINHKLKQLNVKKVVFCWNEASGYGGHSVAIDLDKSCLECLYTDDNGFSMGNRLSLVKAGQNISKNLTGCAGVFTPFSYLDSSQTAAAASKQCVNLLLGDNHPQAISWKGEDRYGLKVTDRFNTMPLKEEIGLECSKTCRVCNG